MNIRVLIVDDDPWIRRMVGSVMEHRGYQIETAQDGKEGLEKALQYQPDLIITDVMMPGMDGWAFIRALRSHQSMSLIPVIFLTALNSDDDRILGFRLGADDYLAKPFRFEELDLRVERVLRNSETLRNELQQRPDEGAVGFKGDLTHLGLSAVLTMLELERKSGILVIKGNLVGRVFIKAGQAVSAFFDNQEAPRNAEAVYEMLKWNSGKFEFNALDVDMADQINMTTTHLLMEGARLIDESTSGLDRPEFDNII